MLNSDGAMTKAHYMHEYCAKQDKDSSSLAINSREENDYVWELAKEYRGKIQIKL